VLLGGVRPCLPLDQGVDEVAQPPESLLLQPFELRLLAAYIGHDPPQRGAGSLGALNLTDQSQVLL
jgi:hypothetical protein